MSKYGLPSFTEFTIKFTKLREMLSFSGVSHVIPRTLALAILLPVS